MITLSDMDKSFGKCGVLLAVFFTTLLCIHGDTGGNKPCTDSDGQIIPHSKNFIPDLEDACKICTCDNGYPILCRTAACSPPPGCKQVKPVPRKCCQFKCEDDDGNSMPPIVDYNTTRDGTPTVEDDNITNLSLRLVGSTVTSFLVLALLLFMVHRLRQRRLMMAMRRFEAQARQQRGDEDELDHYIPAAFLQIECPPYEDPPPPYSPPKPPHILPEESPPPYQEVENNTTATTQLDANANVSNNNTTNNNNNSDQPRPEAPGCQVPEPEQRGPNHSSGANNIIDIMDAFSGSSEPAHRESLGSPLGRGLVLMSTNTSREDGGTELQVISRRASGPVERTVIPFHQDYSLFVGRSPDLPQPKEVGTVLDVAAIASGSHDSRQRGGNSSSNTSGGTSRGGSRGGVRRTGRSCSFSVAPRQGPDPDCAASTSPMAHSYHATTSTASPATTADSGVQTHGSYTASLSRHRARALGANTEQAKAGGGGVLREEGEEHQRMVTKPMAKCDASMQHNHRMLQEELRRSLPPPAFVSAGDSDSDRQQRLESSNPGAANTDTTASLARQGDCASGGVIGCISPDAGSGLCVSSPDHSPVIPAPLPRSQSVNSTFSVCSETGEVRLKRAMAEAAEGMVLQSDSQYPDRTVPRPSPPQLSLAEDLHHHNHHQHHPLETAAASTQDSPSNPCSLPDYTFPTQAALFPAPAAVTTSGPQCTSRSEAHHTPRTKSGGSGSSSRRSVPAPPSQELLRPGAGAGSNSRSHAAKPKHKKIHLVPLEKSRTFRSKKDKSGGKGGGKKGSGDAEPNARHDIGGVSGSRVAASSAAPSFPEAHPLPECSGGGSDSRMHQPKLADIMRGRLAVKQYGFVDSFAAGPQTDEGGGFVEPAVRTVGTDSPLSAGMRTNPHAYHTLPHKLHASHTSTVATPHHASSHRRPFSHVSHVVNPQRTKTKPRPLSGGPVVEPGRDPADPVAALPLNSVARRRGKTLHSKKGRQSYPNPDAMPERKANCVDLGFVEPGHHDPGRSLCLDGDPTSHSKRRAVDRGATDKSGFGSGPSGVLEGQMSSYV